MPADDMTPSAGNAGRRAEDTRRPYAVMHRCLLMTTSEVSARPLFGIHCVAPGLQLRAVRRCHALIPSSLHRAILCSPQLCRPTPSASCLPRACFQLSNSRLPVHRAFILCSRSCVGAGRPLFALKCSHRCLLSVVLCCPRSAERDRSSPQPRVIVVRRWAQHALHSPMLVP